MDSRERKEEERFERLSSLKEGECCTVKHIFAEGACLCRLTDLGVTEGAKIRCVRKSIFGDPVAYEIRGALIALRNETAVLISVSGSPGNANGRS